MSKHTPGPWLIAGGTMVYALMDDPRPSRSGPARINRFDCNVQGVNCPHDEKLANALLIAAAPDLLTALEGIIAAEKRFVGDTGIKLDDFVTDAVKVGEAAIAKARGEKS